MTGVKQPVGFNAGVELDSRCWLESVPSERENCVSLALTKYFQFSHSKDEKPIIQKSIQAYGESVLFSKQK